MISFPKFSAIHFCRAETRIAGGISAILLAGVRATPGNAQTTLGFQKTVTHKASKFP